MASAFTRDTSGHITAYDACSDNGDDCADADDTFIEWNARGLAEQVTPGANVGHATPTGRTASTAARAGREILIKASGRSRPPTAPITTTTKTTRKYDTGAYGAGRRRNGGAAPTTETVHGIKGPPAMSEVNEKCGAGLARRKARKLYPDR